MDPSSDFQEKVSTGFFLDIQNVAPVPYSNILELPISLNARDWIPFAGVRYLLDGQLSANGSLRKQNHIPTG